MRIFGVLCFLLLVSACSSPTARPPVQLYPLTHVSSSNIGNQQAVFVTVNDARNTNSYSTANIANDEPVSQIMTTQITQGLQKQGFVPVNAATTQDNQLTITLNKMNYQSLSGMVSQHTQTSLSAEVKAIKPNGEIYTKTYKTHATNQSVLQIASQTPSAEVNNAFDKLLNNILNDQSLIQFLAKP